MLNKLHKTKLMLFLLVLHAIKLLQAVQVTHTSKATAALSNLTKVGNGLAVTYCNQEKYIHSCLSLLSHCGLIFNVKEWKWCELFSTSKTTTKKNSTDGESFIRSSLIILACEKNNNFHTLDEEYFFNYIRAADEMSPALH